MRLRFCTSLISSLTICNVVLIVVAAVSVANASMTPGAENISPKNWLVQQDLPLGIFEQQIRQTKNPEIIITADAQRIAGNRKSTKDWCNWSDFVREHSLGSHRDLSSVHIHSCFGIADTKWDPEYCRSKGRYYRPIRTVSGEVICVRK